MLERSDNSQLTEIPLASDGEEWTQCQLAAEKIGVPCVSLRELSISPNLLKKLTADNMRTYKMIPISEDENVVTLAMADPIDVVAEDVARYATGCRIRRVMTPLSHILEVLDGKRPQTESLLDAILSRIPESGEITYIQSADASAEQQQKESAELEPTAPVIQLVSSIIGDAIRMGASDIHVEPLKHAMRVRYRLDGYLRTILELPQRVQSSCITRLKIISGLDISESRKPQDGRTRAVLEGREVDMRVSSLPTYFGEKVVLRILDPKAVMVDLDRLGFTERDLENLKQVLSSSQGMILCTGPTGSGKTSTLYSALIRLNQECDNVVTVEDPIEYQLDGINQVQVNARAGVTFASALRSILRQDPDVVLIGEIRDLETAEIAVQSAQTGHLVLSTLHTNDSLSTVSRLVLMGIAPYLLASSLLCVIAQRLVRRLCPHCRKQVEPSPAALALLRAAGTTQIPQQTYGAEGCEHCNYLGYRGRMGIFEFLLVTDRIRQLLLEQASESEIEKVARSEGMQNLLEDGLQKCQDGLTSLDEVLSVLTIRRIGGRRCPECDASIATEHFVCPYCGAALQLQCVACHEPLHHDWHFCPKCKHPVGTVEETSMARVPTSELPELAVQKNTILLVSSDEALCRQVAGCLLDEKYCVLTAHEASRAMAMIYYHTPDLVLLDIDTPNLCPVEWIRKLRSRLESSLVCVVLLTTQGPEAIRGLESGADSYLLKPFAEASLLTRMEETLQHHPRVSSGLRVPALTGSPDS